MSLVAREKRCVQLIASLLVCPLVVVLSGCSGDEESGSPPPSREEVDIGAKSDGDMSVFCLWIGADAGCDLCLELGWYDDEICDDFCDLPDPDCGTEYCGDGTLPMCMVIEPECPDGLVREVVDSCWGECVDPETCEPAPDPRPRLTEAEVEVFPQMSSGGFISNYDIYLWGCYSAEQGIEATFDGKPMWINNPGDPTRDPCPPMMFRVDSIHHEYDRNMETGTFVVSDGEDTLTIEVANPYLNREIEIVEPDDAVLRPGQEVTVRWSPEGDELSPDTVQGAFFREAGWAGGPTSWTVGADNLEIDGSYITFVVPESTVLGDGRLSIQNLAGCVPISRCDGPQHCSVLLRHWVAGQDVTIVAE